MLGRISGFVIIAVISIILFPIIGCSSDSNLSYGLAHNTGEIISSNSEITPNNVTIEQLAANLDDYIGKHVNFMAKATSQTEDYIIVSSIKCVPKTLDNPLMCNDYTNRQVLLSGQVVILGNGEIIVSDCTIAPHDTSG